MVCPLYETCCLFSLSAVFAFIRECDFEAVRGEKRGLQLNLPLGNGLVHSLWSHGFGLSVGVLMPNRCHRLVIEMVAEIITLVKPVTAKLGMFLSAHAFCLFCVYLFLKCILKLEFATKFQTFVDNRRKHFVCESVGRQIQ